MQASLSIEQARKLVLHSQQLPPPTPSGTALAATLDAIEQLSYVQIDTISVVQRAHHHTLWNRNPRYKLSHLESLLEKKQIFEYWSHAAAYLPMADYRFSLFRKNALARGDQSHWYKRDEKMMRYVLDRITAEGPLMAKDFDYNGEKIADWGSKPAKQTLEYLFMQGELMIPKRHNFHKVYDLTERVLPADVNDKTPSQPDHARFLIRRFLRANGVGQVSEFSYLLKQVKPILLSVIDEMIEDDEIVAIQLGKADIKTNYFALTKSLALLNKPLARRKLKILSPFDNLLIQRKRMIALFDFDYQIECYVPQENRHYGYFVLPILWGGRFAGRMDCKAGRQTGTLHIHNLFIERWVKDIDGFKAALKIELNNFSRFNQCDEISPSIDQLIKLPL